MDAMPSGMVKRRPAIRLIPGTSWHPLLYGYSRMLLTNILASASALMRSATVCRNSIDGCGLVKATSPSAQLHAIRDETIATTPHVVTHTAGIVALLPRRVLKVSIARQRAAFVEAPCERVELN